VEWGCDRRARSGCDLDVGSRPPPDRSPRPAGRLLIQVARNAQAAAIVDGGRTSAGRGHDMVGLAVRRVAPRRSADPMVAQPDESLLGRREQPPLALHRDEFARLLSGEQAPDPTLAGTRPTVLVHLGGPLSAGVGLVSQLTRAQHLDRIEHMATLARTSDNECSLSTRQSRRRDMHSGRPTADPRLSRQLTQLSRGCARSDLRGPQTRASRTPERGRSGHSSRRRPCR
jgi:hypothetical protein